MSTVKIKEIKYLIEGCKSELLNHTLQDEIVSPNIKKIKSYLDNCLAVLESDWIERTRKRVTGDLRHNGLFFSFCMSKWDYPFINSVTGSNFNQSEAFDYLANKLGVKENTLRNYRDTFDPHVKQMRSNRQGWKNKPLNPEFLEVKGKYDPLTEDELIVIAKDIFQDRNGDILTGI